jgi:hypothetical protein
VFVTFQNSIANNRFIDKWPTLNGEIFQSKTELTISLRSTANCVSSVDVFRLVEVGVVVAVILTDVDKPRGGVSSDALLVVV